MQQKKAVAISLGNRRCEIYLLILVSCVPGSSLSQEGHVCRECVVLPQGPVEQRDQINRHHYYHCLQKRDSGAVRTTGAAAPSSHVDSQSGDIRSQQGCFHDLCVYFHPNLNDHDLRRVASAETPRVLLQGRHCGATPK